MNSDGMPRVQVLMYADDIITSSLVQHDNRKLEFNPDPSSPPSRSQNERNVPAAILTHNAHDELSDCGSSTSSSSSSSSSLTSSPSMSLDNKSRMSNNDPLPIDFQFSLPAIIIMILYCLGHASFFDLIMQSHDLLAAKFQNPTRLNIGLMAMGFLILRLSGDIWFYSSGVVDSKPFHNQFKETKLFRLKLANRYIALFKDKKKGEHKIEALKRHALVMDVKTMKWFKRHPNVMVVSSLIGFYLFYLPCVHFYNETCMKFVAIPRQDMINSLPSVKQSEGVNPSPIFRSMLTTGPTPLLSQDERDSWSKQAGTTIPWDDMALKREPMQYISQSCSAINGTLDSFLSLEDRLYLEDELYLRSRLSSYSYYNFFGYGPAYFISSKGWFTISSLVFCFCFYLLTKAKVGFFDL